MNLYGALANAVGISHLAWIFWIFISLAFYVRSLRQDEDGSLWKPVYWATIVITGFCNLTFRGTCPLTTLELRLRAAAGQPVRTSGSFITDLCLDHLGLNVPPWSVCAGMVVLIAASVALVLVWPAGPRRRPLPYYYGHLPDDLDDDL